MPGSIYLSLFKHDFHARLLLIGDLKASKITQSSQIVLARRKTQRDVSQLELLYLQHVQPIHHHHSLNQVSSQINVPAYPTKSAIE